MSNDNYKALLNMGADDYYTAAQVGPFNEVFAELVDAPHVALAAFCAFTIDGSIQNGFVDEASPPPEQWLWGNFDTTEKLGRGWSLTTRASVAGQLQIIARCTCANGTIMEAAADVTGPGFTSPFEQIIVAGLWYSGSTAGAGDALIMLSLNGSLAAVTFNGTPGVGGYLISPYAARLGADPVVAADTSSEFINFISCGYAPAPLTMTLNNMGNTGLFAGSTFKAFYSGYGTASFIFQDLGYDWKHRYEVRSLSSGISSSVAKNPTGAYLPLSGLPNGTFAVPGNVIPDQGNQSPSPSFAVSPFTPVQLNRSAISPVHARLLGLKNIPYYQPPAFTFPTVPPPEA